MACADLIFVSEFFTSESSMLFYMTVPGCSQTMVSQKCMSDGVDPSPGCTGYFMLCEVVSGQANSYSVKLFSRSAPVVAGVFTAHAEYSGSPQIDTYSIASRLQNKRGAMSEDYPMCGSSFYPYNVPDGSHADFKACESIGSGGSLRSQEYVQTISCI